MQQDQRWFFMLALTKMFMASPLLRSRRCFFTLCLFSLEVVIVTFIANVDNKLYPRLLQRTILDRPARKYEHLQPLREMFANASKGKDAGQRSNHEQSWQAKNSSILRLSDLQEVDNKVSVLLLMIVSTAPSRYIRRKVIRDTLWKKCDGIKVSFKV